MTAPLTGNAAIRHIAAELLNTADWLAIPVKSVSVSLYSDGVPSGAQVWFHAYDDAQRFADHYGIGDRVNYNTEPVGTLLYLGRQTYEPGCPTIAGVRCGLRLVCDSPAEVSA
jgi:hypothetical protein